MKTMAKQGGSNPEIPKRDEVDILFDKLVSGEAKECDIDDIDPSRPGWEIFLHFGDVDPRIPGTRAHDDFTTFKYLEKFCVAKSEYKEGTRVLVLSYLDGCCENEFSPEHIALMKKYSPRAKAHEEDQKSAAKTLPPPPSIAARTRDSAADLLANLRVMGSKPPIIREIGVIEAPPQHMPPVIEEAHAPHDYLITIPMKGDDLADILEAVNCADVDGLLQKLEAIADEEKMAFTCAYDDEQNYLVNIYKKAGEQYEKSISHQNLIFILKLPYEKLES